MANRPPLPTADRKVHSKEYSDVTSNERNNDIVIVGGGIYGAALAFDLATAGLGVTLLEADEIASGASGGPGERGVRAVNRDIRELPIAALAQERWKELQQTVEGGVGYRRIGGIQVFDRPFGHRLSEIQAVLHVRAEVQNAMGIPTRVVSGDELREMEPELSASIGGGLFCPNDGVGDHTLATRQFAREAGKAGAAIRTGAKAIELLRSGRTINAVKLAGGETVPVGRHLLLMANRGAPALLKPLLQADERLPVWEFIPQMQYVSNPEKRTINHLLSHMHRRLAVKQLTDGTVMLSGGWTVERVAEGGTSGALGAMSLNVQDSIATFPFLERSEFLKVDHSRVETCALDGIPLIGRPAAVDNLTYGLGWSGHGFAISLGMSRLIADWVITGNRPPLLAPFSPARFNPPAAK